MDLISKGKARKGATILHLSRLYNLMKRNQFSRKNAESSIMDVSRINLLIFIAGKFVFWDCSINIFKEAVIVQLWETNDYTINSYSRTAM